MHRVIAIDGPSGAGKSTVAKRLSEALGFRYLDTGALYRAAALALRRHDTGPDAAEDKIRSILEGVVINFSGGKVFLDGEDVSMEIRSTEIGHYSSVFSALKVVRNFLLPLQRNEAENENLVAEGRDITTVVFPDAWKKFYLDASTDERAKRRFLQLKDNGMPVTMEKAIEDVLERDLRDSSRQIAPLKVAEDAVFIDTSGLSRDEVVEKILVRLRENGGNIS